MTNRPENISPARFSVAIIGGGFTGTTLAAQLLRCAGSSLSVVVVEKSASVGRGLAYGTKSNSLLLNVRARTGVDVRDLYRLQIGPLDRQRL